jgi:hypothetical protein
MLLARADIDLSRTVDATVGLVHDFLVYKMHIVTETMWFVCGTKMLAEGRNEQEKYLKVFAVFD